MSRIIKLAVTAAIAVALTGAIVGIVTNDRDSGSERPRAVRYELRVGSNAPAVTGTVRRVTVQPRFGRDRFNLIPDALVELGPTRSCHNVTWRATTTRTGAR